MNFRQTPYSIWLIKPDRSEMNISDTRSRGYRHWYSTSKNDNLISLHDFMNLSNMFQNISSNKTNMTYGSARSIVKKFKSM